MKKLNTYIQNPKLEPKASWVQRARYVSGFIYFCRAYNRQRKEKWQMTAKLSTTVSQIHTAVANEESRQLILQFFEFVKKIGTSERYQNNNLKAIIAYSRFIGSSISLDQVKCRTHITSFLDSKIKGAIGLVPDPFFPVP